MLFKRSYILVVLFVTFSLNSYAQILPKLHKAARDGNLKNIQKLIEKGVDINERTTSGNSTALHFAVNNDRTEIVKELLNNGADPNIKDIRGRTPIFSSNYDIMKILLDRGSELDVKDILGYNLLLRIIDSNRSEKVEMIKLLLESGVSVNDCDIRGLNAIHLAVLTHESPATMELLLSNVKDVNSKNNQGLTATDLAWLNRKEDLIDILTEYGGTSSIYSSPITGKSRLIEGDLYDNMDGTLGLKKSVEINIGPNIVNYTIKWQSPFLGRAIVQISGWFIAEPNHTYRVDSYGGYNSLVSIPGKVYNESGAKCTI